MFTKVNDLKNSIFSKLKESCLKKFKKLKTTKYINIYTITIFLFSLFVFSPLFFSYIFGDDSTFHAANVAVRGSNLFYAFSKIVPKIGNDLGYGIGIFYPILPHLVGGLILNVISIFGFGEFAALKIVKFLIIFCSGITMYVFATKLFKDKLHGMVASLFYLSSSYFFVDLYSRDALNESAVFVFMPLIFLGIYYLFIENNHFNFYVCFVLGYVGMMYSHLVISVWFTLIFILFLLLFVKKIIKKNYIIPLIIAALLILILTSPFTVLLIQHMLNGEYVIFDIQRPFLSSTLKLKQFFVQISNITSNHNYLFVNFNIVVILLSIISLFKLFTKKIPLYRRKFIIGFLLICLIGMFLVCNDTIWYYTPDFLNSIQFPWRACTFVTLGISLFATESLDVFYNLFKKKFIPVATLLIIIILSANVYYNIQNIQRISDISYNINDGMGWDREYLPTETVKHIQYFINRKDDEIKINKGIGDVMIINNDVPNMVFEVTNVKKPITLELPRLYYLGYKVVDENGNNIDYFKNDNGFISIEINKNGKYSVSYLGTFAYQLSVALCILTLGICAIILFFKYKKQIQNKLKHKDVL